MADAAKPLPALRKELRLLPTAAAVSGEPLWVIHDPVQNRYIQIDNATYHVLANWPSSATDQELLAKLGASGSVFATGEEIWQLAGFLERNRLTEEPAKEGWRAYLAEHKKSQHSIFHRLLHGYLFFRVPLFRPQAALERALPFAEVLATPAMIAFYAILGTLGLYLAARQWESYLATFPDFATLEGAALMGGALLLVKAAHELGHAFAAVRYGCHVPTMGVAFMLAAPLLYTDVTDAWRLRDRRQRLVIDTAGVRVELAIAAVALFLWSFLPDGPARSIAFTLSAVSMVSSLLINLNPFMRFDGYYVFSEMIGVDNLQSRAFELGRWHMRETLFGLGAPKPEPWPPGKTALLISYAYATWVYRLLLFVGIALIVYHVFFKVLGILLFVVEIGIFIARPVIREIGVWIKMRKEIFASRRTVLTGLAASVLVGLAIVPWSSRVAVPAVVEASRWQSVYPPRPARVVQIHVTHGAEVAAGDPVVTLASPDIHHQLRLARTELRLVGARLARRGADVTDREQSLVLERQHQSLVDKIAGLESEIEKLIVRAPIAGKVLELNSELRTGRWLGPKDFVAIVGDRSAAQARGYVSEADLSRIAVGTAGVFVPESIQRGRVSLGVADIATDSAPEIALPELVGTHGGPIAVAATGPDAMVPVTGQYLVRFDVQGSAAPEVALRGTAILTGRPESFLASVWRQTLKVLLREAGA